MCGSCACQLFLKGGAVRRGEAREEWMSGTREWGGARADKKDIVSREPVFDLVWTHFGFRIKDCVCLRSGSPQVQYFLSDLLIKWIFPPKNKE